MNFKVRFEESPQSFAPNFKQSNQSFSSNFSQSEQSFPLDFGEIQTVTEYIGGIPYGGEYEVIPMVVPQTLATAGKILEEDFTVQPIPYAEVSNGSGGTTVTIGNEV